MPEAEYFDWTREPVTYWLRLAQNEKPKSLLRRLIGWLQGD